MESNKFARKGKSSPGFCVIVLFGSLCLSVYVCLYVVSTRQNIHLWMHIKELQQLEINLNFLQTAARSVSQRRDATKEKNIPLLTLFTTWSMKGDKLIANNNTVMNWLSLRPYVLPVLFTNDTKLATMVTSQGWNVFPVPRTVYNIPVIKDMYLTVMKKYKSRFYGYSNGDILYTDFLITTLRTILNSTLPVSKPMLVVGRRTNVKDVTRKEAASWKTLRYISKSRGWLFSSFAEDYFITTPDYPWKDIPDIVVGRRGYDNWLVLNNRKKNYTTVDASSTLLAVHQTTKAGNFENHKSTHPTYNLQLLSKLYKKINYVMGLTGCAENFTKFDHGTPVVTGRNPPKACGKILK